MKIAVYGLWHLGSVTAACLARKGMDVIGIDPDANAVQQLMQGKAPLFEPGLDELIAQGIKSGKLRFTTALEETLHDVDLVWITIDTPVDDNDKADIAFLNKSIKGVFSAFKPGTPLLLSSQIPMGYSRTLKNLYKRLQPKEELIFCYSPENLRLGNALASFDQPTRIIAGAFLEKHRTAFQTLFDHLCSQTEWMNIESAEMVKHAINSFLATSITFTNELALLCETYGADARAVERGLKTEPRIGPKAYVKAGAAFAGGTLARDLRFLTALAKTAHQPAYVLNAVLKSNAFHKAWARRRLQKRFRSLKGQRVSVLGLSYKAGTNTLRRSWTIELCRWLLQRGAHVTLYDPSLRALPKEARLQRATLVDSLQQAVSAADSIVIGTDDSSFRQLTLSMLPRQKPLMILDASGILRDSFSGMTKNLHYVTVGQGQSLIQ